MSALPESKPGPRPPENASPEELSAYYRALADAAMAAVVAGPPLPTIEGPCPLCSQEAGQG